MNLIFLHGIANVGKRTIGRALAKELDFPFINFHHLATLLGPVFGYTSDAFYELRNDTTQKTIEHALKSNEEGIICSFIFDPTVPLADYRKHIITAKESGGIGLFVGLTCDEEEMKQRSNRMSRRHDDEVSDRQLLEEATLSETFESPDLPGPSITIDTTGESSEQTIQNIISMLPDSMKQTISY